MQTASITPRQSTDAASSRLSWGPPAALAARRSQVECLLDRACRLGDRDRLLVQQVLRHGISMADIARLADLKPQQVRRRLRTLLQRMRSPLFIFLDSHAQGLPRDTRLVAQRIVFGGQSLRAAAADLNLSLHQVRQHMRSLHTLAQK